MHRISLVPVIAALAILALGAQAPKGKMKRMNNVKPGSADELAREIQSEVTASR